MDLTVKSSELGINLGVIGLGTVGKHVVLRLLGRTCCDLYVYDPDKRSCARAAFVCETAAQVCDACNIIFVALDSEQDHLALLNSIAEFLHEGCTVVDMTPVSPAQAHKNANIMRRAGISYLDCGVFSPDGNLDTPFMFFVGGSGETFTRMCPLLRCVAPNCRHMGPAGRGQAIRMVCLSMAHKMARELEDTIVLAGGLGIGREYFLDSIVDFNLIAQPLAALDGECPAFGKEELERAEHVVQTLQQRLNQNQEKE